MRRSKFILTVPFFIIFTSLSLPVACAQDDEGEAVNLERQFKRLFDTQKYDQAEDFANNALKVMESKRGQSHLDVARMLDNLESVYVRQGKFIEAQQLAERSLLIRTKLLGEEHLGGAKS